MSAPRWITAVSLTLVCPVARAQSRPAARVDWPTFLARQDLVWDRLPTGWGESAFIGNGRLGATIDVRDGAFGWTINRTDVVHDQSRYPIGGVVLKTAGSIQGGTARLVLWDAEARGVLTTDRGAVRWRSFTTSRPSVIVIVLEGTGGESGVALDWSPAEARPPRKVYRKDPFAPEDLHPPPVVTHASHEITSVQTFLNGGAHAESIRRVAVVPPLRNAERGTGGEDFYFRVGQGGTDRGALLEARPETPEARALVRA